MHDDAGREEARSHGRYYAEYVRLAPNEPQGIQALLDERDGGGWHLVGVAGGLPEDGAILFWDTQKPSFGKGTV